MQGLCRCAQVCRTWRDITEDAKLWSKVGGLVHVVKRDK